MILAADPVAFPSWPLASARPLPLATCPECYPPESASAIRARRDRALDLLEWERAFGLEPVGVERWAGVLRPDLSPKAGGRAWLRLREHWRRDGVPFELVDATSETAPRRTRRVLVQLTSASLVWARSVLDEGNDMLTTEPNTIRLGAPEPSWGDHALEVHAAADRYREAVLDAEADGPIAQVLVRELLSLATWFPDLGAPLHRLADDFWGVSVQLLPRVAQAAGLRVYACKTERWVRRDEAAKLLAKLVASEVPS